ANAVLVLRARGLERLLEALAVQAVLPPVVGAADAVGLGEPVCQRRTAVRAVLLETAVAPILQSEDDQVLAHHCDGQRRVLFRDLGRVADWLPVPPEQLAARRARPRLGQESVFFRSQHRYSGGSVCGARATPSPQSQRERVLIRPPLP